MPCGATGSRFRRRSAENKQQIRIGRRIKVAAAGVKRAFAVQSAYHGVDLRVRVIVVAVEKAAEAVEQALERVGRGARLTRAVRQVDGVVAKLAAHARQLAGYGVKRFVPGDALELRRPARPDAAHRPHKAIGAVRPGAHGQAAMARGRGLVGAHARKFPVAQFKHQRTTPRAIDSAKRPRRGLLHHRNCMG